MCCYIPDIPLHYYITAKRAKLTEINAINNLWQSLAKIIKTCHSKQIGCQKHAGNLIDITRHLQLLPIPSDYSRARWKHSLGKNEQHCVNCGHWMMKRTKYGQDLMRSAVAAVFHSS